MKLKPINKRLDAIDKEIQALSLFRPTPELQKFLRQLQGERSHVLQRIEQMTRTQQEQELECAERLEKAQHNRSEKMKRNWRYVKAIADNYGIPPKKVRSELKKRKKGLESDVDDVVWRNPSP